MENWVYPPLSWQLQSIGHPADLSFNSEWAYKPSLQLGRTVSHPQVTCAEQHKVTWSVHRFISSPSVRKFLH